MNEVVEVEESEKEDNEEGQNDEEVMVRGDKGDSDEAAEERRVDKRLALQNVDAHWLKTYLIQQIPALIPEDVPELEA